MSGLAWPSAFPGVVTQKFGAVSLVNEPAGYSDGKRAASSQFPGATYGAHVHRGLDIRAYEGTNLYAAEAGTVIKATSFSNGELYMQLRISPTTVLQYDHCSAFVAAVGQQVQRGALIAKAGHTGNALAAHLHFEVQITDGIVYRWDPALFLEALGGTWPIGEDVGNINAATQDPGLLCDIAGPTPLYKDEGCTIIATGTWPGSPGVGLYSSAATPAVKALPVRISLSPGVWDVLYAPFGAVSKVRAKPVWCPPPSGTAGQAELDAATKAGFATAKAKAIAAVGAI